MYLYMNRKRSSRVLGKWVNFVLFFIPFHNFHMYSSEYTLVHVFLVLFILDSNS